jgi:DNA invertase Pin-like site-specific DNA recombinase
LITQDNPGADIRCIIGYARCSTEGQSIDGQIADLKAAGAKRIYSEKVSGARTDRQQLGRAIASLEPDDVLLVTRLDRLARSTRDLLNVLATTSPHGRLILAVLGALAEVERSMILSRTSEGRKRARARGVRFGRKPKLTEYQIKEAAEGSWREPKRYREEFRSIALNDIEALIKLGEPPKFLLRWPSFA